MTTKFPARVGVSKKIKSLNKQVSTLFYGSVSRLGQI